MSTPQLRRISGLIPAQWRGKNVLLPDVATSPSAQYGMNSIAGQRLN
ncbi:hypothetical protein [Nocardia camponoti]|nr:hypothetical protein [Nocardia camponoti]